MYSISSTNSASFVAADIFQTPFMLRHSARPALWCRSFPNPRKAFRCCLKTCQRTRGVDVNAMDDGFWGAYQRFAYDCDNSMNCTNYMDIHKKLELDLKQAVKKFHVFYSLAAIFMIACQLAWRPSQPRNQDSSYQTGKSLRYVKSGMDSSWLRNNHWIHPGPPICWNQLVQLRYGDPNFAHVDAIGNLKPDIFQDCTFLEVAQWHEATLGPSATPLALELHHDPRRRRSSVVCKYAKEAQAEARSEGTGRNWKELEQVIRNDSVGQFGLGFCLCHFLMIFWQFGISRFWKVDDWGAHALLQIVTVHGGEVLSPRPCPGPLSAKLVSQKKEKATCHSMAVGHCGTIQWYNMI